MLTHVKNILVQLTYGTHVKSCPRNPRSNGPTQLTQPRNPQYHATHTI